MSELNLGALNFVDIAMLVIFGLSIIIGFGRGLISEIISLLALIAAFIVAIMFTSQLAEFFTHTETVQNVVTQSSSAIGMSTDKPVTYMALGVSFAILFGATIIVGSVIKVLLNLIFTVGMLGFGNRIMGALFGIVRGYLICLAIIFLIQLSPLAKQPWWAQSKYVPYFQDQVVMLGNKVSPILADLKSTFSDQMQDVKGGMDEMTKQIIPDKTATVTPSTDKAPEKMSATNPPAAKK